MTAHEKKKKKELLLVTRQSESLGPVHPAAHCMWQQSLGREPLHRWQPDAQLLRVTLDGKDKSRLPGVLSANRVSVCQLQELTGLAVLGSFSPAACHTLTGAAGACANTQAQQIRQQTRTLTLNNSRKVNSQEQGNEELKL